MSSALPDASATSTPTSPSVPMWLASVTLVVYLIVLAMIVLWPTPVDRDAGSLLDAITEQLPFLTYERIEFAANVALFVPFGMLLAIVLRSRELVLPIALVTTVLIEALQATLLEERTADFSDVVANVTGASVGLLLIALTERVFRRRRPPAAATPE